MITERVMLQDDPKFRQAMRARNPEQRLRAFLHHCQGKRECPYTNAPQPIYRLDGVKISLEFPKPKSDDDAPAETGDRKQVPASADWFGFLCAQMTS